MDQGSDSRARQSYYPFQYGLKNSSGAEIALVTRMTYDGRDTGDCNPVCSSEAASFVNHSILLGRPLRLGMLFHYDTAPACRVSYRRQCWVITFAI